MHESLIQVDLSALDFSSGAVLLNRSKRLVLPIPELPDGGEPLIFPTGHPKAGENIYSNDDGTPQRGIVFPNKTDSGWQGVQGNGNEAIIINDLTSEQATQVLQYIRKTVSDIITITPEEVLTVIRHCHDELGLFDMFDKDLPGVVQQMRPVDGQVTSPTLSDLNSFLLYMEVSKETEHRALRIDRGFTPVGGSIDQRYPRGAVVVNDGKWSWGLDKGVCERNWVHKGDQGAEISIESVDSEIPLITL